MTVKQDKKFNTFFTTRQKSQIDDIQKLAVLQFKTKSKGNRETQEKRLNYYSQNTSGSDTH